MNQWGANSWRSICRIFLQVGYNGVYKWSMTNLGNWGNLEEFGYAAVLLYQFMSILMFMTQLRLSFGFWSSIAVIWQFVIISHKYYIPIMDELTACSIISSVACYWSKLILYIVINLSGLPVGATTYHICDSWRVHITLCSSPNLCIKMDCKCVLICSYSTPNFD